MTNVSSPIAEEILPGVYRVACPFGDGGTVYVYFIAAPEAALIDTGVKQSPAEVIEPALSAVGFSLIEVRHLFNTHGHWDHMGGNEEVRRATLDVTTYLAPEDLHLMKSVEAHVLGYASYPYRLLDDQAGLDEVNRIYRPGIDVPAHVDVLVNDGDTFSLGGRVIRVVRTPGHSHGSTSYLLEDAGALFTGDSIQGLGSRPGQLPLVFDDSQAYRATLARVAELPLEALCTGHAFCGLNPDQERDAVRRGDAARTFLVESGQAAKAVEEVSRNVLQERPGLEFLEFARRVFARLEKPLHLELAGDGLSARSMATAHAFYRELTGAPPPA